MRHRSYKQERSKAAAVYDLSSGSRNIVQGGRMCIVWDVLSKGRSIPKTLGHSANGDASLGHYKFEVINICNLTDKQSLKWFASDKRNERVNT